MSILWGSPFLRMRVCIPIDLDLQHTWNRCILCRVYDGIRMPCIRSFRSIVRLMDLLTIHLVFIIILYISVTYLILISSRKQTINQVLVWCFMVLSPPIHTAISSLVHLHPFTPYYRSIPVVKTLWTPDLPNQSHRLLILDILHLRHINIPYIT